MRFAFRCPLVWDQPPTEERRWCGVCDRWVHDLVALPDLDVHQWIREHPGECVRAPVDREGNMLARTAAVAVLVQPCADEAVIELDPPVCEVRELEEPGVSEVLLPLPPPLPAIEPAEEMGVAAPVLLESIGYVSAGYPAREPISMEIPVLEDVYPTVLPPRVEAAPEPPRKRGLWKRLFGRKRNR
jgi:hypothetical protein